MNVFGVQSILNVKPTSIFIDHESYVGKLKWKRTEWIGATQNLTQEQNKRALWLE